MTRSTIDPDRAVRAVIGLTIIFAGLPLVIYGAFTQPHWTILALIVVGLPAILLPRPLRDDYPALLTLLVAAIAIVAGPAVLALAIQWIGGG